VAVVAVLVFTTLRGGISLPSQAPGSAAGSVALATASPTPSPSPAPTASPSPTPSPSPAPTASPSPSPAPTASPSPSPSLPAAYQGLKPCPGSPACYLYRVHAGDSLTAIALRFGITLQALKAANPSIKDPSLLHVGDILRIPLP
jgi:LysM repeat protein